jgi:S1-C subfamily serine protease
MSPVSQSLAEKVRASVGVLVALTGVLAAAPLSAQDAPTDPPPTGMTAVAEERTEERTIERTEERTTVTTTAEHVSVAATPATTCIGAVNGSARASIVRVESGLAVGAGFLAIDATHVVTSRSLVADGHGVRVVDAEGNARSATVIVSAPDDDLALLELATALPAAALDVAGWEALDVGREVVVVSFALGDSRHGRSGRGEFEFSMTSGALNAIGERSIQIDAHPAVVGSPVIDCHGDVVGVARRGMMMLTGDDFTFGTGSNAVADLLSRADHPEAHGGRVRLSLGLGLSSVFEDLPTGLEPDWLMGGYLQLALTVNDAFVLAARGHYLQGGTEPSGSDVLRREARRFRIDAYAGWRQLVQFGPGMGFHFELGLGASASLLRDQNRRLLNDGMGLRFVDEISERWRVRPMVVVNVDFSFVQLSYQLELELEDRGRLDAGGGHAYHVFSIGARF